MAEQFRTNHDYLESCLRQVIWRVRLWQTRRLALSAENDPFRYTESLSSLLTSTPAAVTRGTVEPAVEAAKLAADTLADLKAAHAIRLAASCCHVSSPILALEELRASLGLGEGTTRLLQWLTLYATCMPFAEVISAILPAGYGRPSLGIVLEMLDLSPAEVSEVRGQLGSLETLGIMAIGRDRTGPLAHQVVWMPADALLQIVESRRMVMADIQRPLSCPDIALDRLRAALAAPLRSGVARCIVLFGQPGVGRKSMAAYVARDHGRGLVAAGQTRTTVDAFLTEVAATLRQAAMSGAVVLLRSDRCAGAWTSAQCQRLMELLAAHGAPVICTAIDRATFPWSQWISETLTLTVSWDPERWGPVFWRTTLARYGLRCADSPETLARRVHATPGLAVTTLTRWLEHRPRRPGDTLELNVSSFLDALDVAHAPQLGSVAELLKTELEWEDLIATTELSVQLRDVLDHAHHHEEVFEEWGFRKKVPYGRGLAVLFHGPPGTGKTMAAMLIGKSLGRPTYRVDLSKIVDKYIGETEKHLARLFAMTRSVNAVLLFDEADSLFGSRTQVQNSNDRHANQEVNFLLQQIEDFEGVAILTTNNIEAIDSAFKRRLRFSVPFPEPSERERARMWRAFIPSRAPVDPDIDAAALGRMFDISGGHIKQAVLRAAFRAAANGRAIAHADLRRAAEQACRELGKLWENDRDPRRRDHTGEFGRDAR